MNIKAWLNTLGTTSRTLPIVILYVTEGCNLKCCMCSYRTPLPNELTIEEIRTLARALSEFGLRHIVFSGGEPLVRKDFPDICDIFKAHGVKQTVLTNGLLLGKRLDELGGFFHGMIVSLDGAVAGTHNAIRGVDSFEAIINGISEAVQRHSAPEISIRAVVQKKNFRELPQLVDLAQSLGVHRISFLAADVLSDSFGRKAQAGVHQQDSLALSAEEVTELQSIIEGMILTHSGEFDSRFISESPEKMRRIVQYFQALLGSRAFPRNTCNAPMVSAVITSTGEVQPCFFLPSDGNIRNNNLQSIMNDENIITTRSNVKNYLLDRCKTCVCTLYVPPTQALLDRF